MVRHTLECTELFQVMALKTKVANARTVKQNKFWVMSSAMLFLLVGPETWDKSKMLLRRNKLKT